MNPLQTRARETGRWLLAGLRPAWHLPARYPLVLAPVAGMLVLLWGFTPDAFDAVHIVWADDVLTAVFTGFGFAVLAGGVMTLAWWLDAHRAATADPPRLEPAGAPYVAGWVLLCLLALAPAVVRGDLFPTEIPVPAGATANPDAKPERLPAQFVWLGVHRARLCLPAGVALALLVGLVGYALAGRIGRRAFWWLGWGPPLVVFAGYVGVSLIHWTDPGLYLPVITAPVAALLLLGLVVTAAALLHRFGQSRCVGAAFYPVVVGGLLAVVLAGGYFEPVHQVPGLEVYYGRPVERRPQLDQYEAYRTGPGGPADDPLVRDEEALEAWKARMAPPGPGGRPGKPGPVVVVTVSGGASTSALFVARSLFRLEARFPGFVDRVRVVTGASGGMLGAAYFVAQFRPGSPYRREGRADGFATLAAGSKDDADRFRRAYADYLARLERGDATPGPDEQVYRDGMAALEARFIAGLEQDFLGPLVQKWIHKDMNPVAGLIPAGTTNDRGTALELTWDRHLLGRPTDGGWDTTLPSLDVPFDDLRADERRGVIPSLVFTPMMVEDGRQLLVSNLDLNYMVDWASYDDPDAGGAEPAPGEGPRRTYSAVEFYRLFPEAVGQFRLRTAVRLNASFPVFSPAAELPTNPPRRVVDAGYYDNYGLSVATRWIEKNRGWFERNDVPVWVVQLWTYGYDQRGGALVTREEGDLLGADRTRRAVAGGGLRSSTAPVSGLFAAWRANMSYRGDERLNRVLLDLNATRGVYQPPLGYRFRKDIGGVALPMNWVLTSRSLAQVNAESREFTALADKVRRAAAGGDAVVDQDYPKLPAAEKAGVREKANLAGQLYDLSKQFRPPPAPAPVGKPKR
jgi:hypothetical protein